MPATRAGEAYDISQRYCDLPISSRKVIPDDYEHNNNDNNEKYNKF